MDGTPRGHDVERPAGRVQALPDERLLVLEGDVDLSAVETFDRSTSDDLAWVRSIDVSGVSFVDTQGLGLLLRVAAPRGRDAPTDRPALLGASPQVQQLLEMLGVDALFEMRAVPGDDGAAADELRPPA
ncbi:STAS domain-containing protein [Pseudokineococcus marinus]|uniref:STAS domain-containing protein n=1 Tax=Pseudokineococcus marinus TaxID=351215 RepID=A0A849BRV4_9ACTN|nr:STAS domain-containing protein [Pseudokineococcus marinus]NNH23562.1 STAS domain-containing protein [Pseudokineococcus marinus]